MSLRFKILCVALGVFIIQIALLSWMNWGKTELPMKKVDVLLVSYHRAGSSFMSELLASCEECSYFFEPLFYEDHIRHQPYQDAYFNNLKNIYGCDGKTLDEFVHNKDVWILRKFGQRFSWFNEGEDVIALCKKDPYHVVKTIRLHLKDIADQLLDEIPTLKIVHLVRDPRAISNSVNNLARIWNDKERSSEQLCQDMYSDVETGASLPKDRYLLIRYEDFVENAMNYSISMFDFLKIPFTPRVKRYVQAHTQAENHPVGKKEANEYFSTFRNSSYVHDRWKFQLPVEAIQAIENECTAVMSALKYATYHNPTS